MDNEFIDKDTLEKLEKASKEKEKVKSVKKKKTAQRKPSAFVQIINGDFLTKEFMLTHFNFIFFILFLLMLIIGKGYYGKQVIDEVNENQSKLDEISSDFVEKKAKLQEETRRRSLADKLNNTGLKETENPTKVIRIKK